MHLASVVLPDHPVALGSRAFRDCGQLADAQGRIIVQNTLFQYVGPGGHVVVPDGVIRIDNWAFGNCTEVTSVALPDSVTSIGESAFIFCGKLTEVHLPDGLVFLGTSAFQHCASLTQVTLPDRLVRIGDRAFHNCKAMADAQGFVIFRGVLYSYHGTDSHVTIPDTVTVIGDSAFRNNAFLTGVTLHDGITDLRDAAFARCKNLTGLSVPVRVRHIGRLAFGGCTKLTLRWDGHGDMHPTAFEQVPCVILPHVPFSFFHDASAQRAAVRGFFRTREAYTDSEIRWRYLRYALDHRTMLLPWIFQEDCVEALAFYGEQHQITAENIEADYLNPAVTAHATECTAFLLEYRHRKLADCAAADEFTLE
jgi:hypothetical protein